MAFVLQNWNMDTGSANIYGFVNFNYITTTDTIATVSAANYFSSVAYGVQVGSQIIAVCSNGTVYLQVATVNTAVNPATITTTTIISGGTGVLAIATGTLTQANWTGMFAAPVSLIAAQGAGVSIIIESAVLNYHFATAAYSGGGLTVLQYGNTVNGAGPAAAVTLAAAGFSDQGSSRFAVLEGGVLATAITSSNNVAIFISNQTAAFAAGNASATIAWSITYRTITLT